MTEGGASGWYEQLAKEKEGLLAAELGKKRVFSPSKPEILVIGACKESFLEALLKGLTGEEEYESATKAFKGRITIVSDSQYNHTLPAKSGTGAVEERYGGRVRLTPKRFYDWRGELIERGSDKESFHAIIHKGRLDSYLSIHEYVAVASGLLREGGKHLFLTESCTSELSVLANQAPREWRRKGVVATDEELLTRLGKESYPLRECRILQQEACFPPAQLAERREGLAILLSSEFGLEEYHLLYREEGKKLLDDFLRKHEEGFRRSFSILVIRPPGGNEPASPEPATSLDLQPVGTTPSSR